MGRPLHGPSLHHPRPHIMILERPWPMNWFDGVDPGRVRNPCVSTMTVSGWWDFSQTPSCAGGSPKAPNLRSSARKSAKAPGTANAQLRRRCHTARSEACGTPHAAERPARPSSFGTCSAYRRANPVCGRSTFLVSSEISFNTVRPEHYTSRSCGRVSPSASPSRSRNRGSGKVSSRASAAIVSPFCSANAKARLTMMGISPG